MVLFTLEDTHRAVEELGNPSSIKVALTVPPFSILATAFLCPAKEYSNHPFLGTSILYSPLLSVVVPLCVCFTIIEVPGSGLPSAPDTIPST